MTSATYYLDLLSALVLDPTVIPNYQEFITPDVWVLEDHKTIAKHILKLYNESHAPPTRDMLKRDVLSNGVAEARKANLTLMIDRMYNADPRHSKTFQRELKTQLEIAANESAAAQYTRLVKDRKFKKAHDVVRRVMGIGQGATGFDYFDDERVAKRLDPSVQIYERTGHVATGFRGIDEALYGGPAAKELYYVIADTGEGKSRFLLNLVANGSKVGKKMFYVSFELEEPVCEGRLDQIFTGLPIQQVKTELGKERLMMAKEQVRMSGGYIHIKKWPEHRCSVADLSSYIMRQGINFDAVIIDYVDKMRIVDTKGNFWLAQASHFDQVRADIARAHDCVVWTATQKNKDGDYFGAQGKQATMDGAWKVHMTKTDYNLKRFWLQEDKARYSSGKPGGMRFIVRPDGMGIQEVHNGEWPHGYRDEDLKQP